MCGDPWDGPRENEAGGKYASGIIVGNYTAGQLLEVKLDITASHKGFHEFRLCPVGSPQTKATRECFDQNVLKLQNGETKFNEPGATGTYSVKLVLPETLTCTQCVLQWKWNTGIKIYTLIYYKIKKYYVASNIQISKYWSLYIHVNKIDVVSGA